MSYSQNSIQVYKITRKYHTQLQVLTPCVGGDPYEKRYIPWKGDNNVYWKTDVAQGTIKTIVELAPKTFKEFETNACI